MHCIDLSPETQPFLSKKSRKSIQQPAPFKYLIFLGSFTSRNQRAVFNGNSLKKKDQASLKKVLSLPTAKITFGPIKICNYAWTWISRPLPRSLLLLTVQCFANYPLPGFLDAECKRTNFLLCFNRREQSHTQQKIHRGIKSQHGF